MEKFEIKRISVDSVKEQLHIWVDETYTELNDYCSYMDLLIDYANILDKAVELCDKPQLFIDNNGELLYLDNDNRLWDAYSNQYQPNEYVIVDKWTDEL